MKKFLYSIVLAAACLMPAVAAAQVAPPENTTMADGTRRGTQSSATQCLNAAGTAWEACRNLSGATGTNSQQVQGNVASGATDVGNPVKVGMRVVTVKSGLTTGIRTDMLSDPFGNLYMRPVTTILSGFNGLGAAWGAAGANDNAAYAGAPMGALCFMYNGTNIDACRGDTTGGLYTQERERSQYGFELPGALPANGTYTGAGRDGGPSPSQWGTFSCFVRSDQASAAGGFGIQGSNDGTNWVIKVLASVAAATSVRITDRNDTRYSRCVLTNGATANTLAPNINWSFGQ